MVRRLVMETGRGSSPSRSSVYWAGCNILSNGAAFSTAQLRSAMERPIRRNDPKLRKGKYQGKSVSVHHVRQAAHAGFLMSDAKYEIYTSELLRYAKRHQVPLPGNIKNKQRDCFDCVVLCLRDALGLWEDRWRKSVDIDPVDDLARPLGISADALWAIAEGYAVPYNYAFAVQQHVGAITGDTNLRIEDTGPNNKAHPPVARDLRRSIVIRTIGLGVDDDRQQWLL